MVRFLKFSWMLAVILGVGSCTKTPEEKVAYKADQDLYEKAAISAKDGYEPSDFTGTKYANLLSPLTVEQLQGKRVSFTIEENNLYVNTITPDNKHTRVYSYPIAGHYDLVPQRNAEGEKTYILIPDQTENLRWEDRAYIKLNWQSFNLAEAPADSTANLFKRADFLADGTANLVDNKLPGKIFVAGKDSIPVMNQNKEISDILFGPNSKSQLRLTSGEEVRAELTEKNLNFYARGELIAQFPIKGNYNLINNIDSRGRTLAEVVKREWTEEEARQNPLSPRKQPWYEREYVEIDPAAGSVAEATADLRKNLYPRQMFLTTEDLSNISLNNNALDGKTFIVGKDIVPVISQNEEISRILFGDHVRKDLHMEPGEELRAQLTEFHLNFYANGQLVAQFPIEGNYNLLNDIDAHGQVLLKVVKAEWTDAERRQNPTGPQKQAWYQRSYVEVNPAKGKVSVPTADTKHNMYPIVDFLQLDKDGTFNVRLQNDADANNPENSYLLGKTYKAGDDIPILSQNKELYDRLLCTEEEIRFQDDFCKTLTLHSNIILREGDEVTSRMTERNLNFYAHGVLIAQFPIKGHYNLLNKVDVNGHLLLEVDKFKWTEEARDKNPGNPEEQPWHEREYAEIDPRQGKELVDKTRVGFFPKSVLMGKEFLYRETVTDIHSSANFLAVGYTSWANTNVSTIKFKFGDEFGNSLVAYPVKEYTNNSNATEEVLRFNVRTFDVVLAKDANGERGSTLVETTEEQPWPKHNYMNVDGVTANNFYYSMGLYLQSLYLQNTKIDGELHYEDGGYVYFDTISTFVDNWSGRTYTMKRRHSLLALAPTDYNARHYSPYDNSRFGMFTSDRFSLDENGMPTVGTEEYWANIYDVRADNDKQIVWYVNKEWPEEFMDVARESVKEWNRAFQSALGRKDDVVILDESIRPEGADAVADPRKNVLVYVNDFGATQPAGLGPLLSDPRNGRVISGKAYMYKTAIEGARNSLKRIFDYLENGHSLPKDRLGFVPPQTFDPKKVNGVGTPFVLDPAVAAAAGRGDMNGGDPSDVVASLRSAKIFINDPFSDDVFAMPTIPYNKISGNGFIFDHQVPSIDMDLMVKGNSVGSEDTYARSIDYLVKQIESGLLDQDVDLLFNQEQPDIQSLKSSLERTKKIISTELLGKQEHDFVNSLFNQGAACEYKMDVTTDAAIKFILAQPNWKQNREKIISEITAKYLYGVTLHEMGHNFGFQHNFKGSLDYRNFHEGYAEARKEFDEINSAKELAVICGLTEGGNPTTAKASCDAAKASGNFALVADLSDGALVELANKNSADILFEKYRVSSVMEYPNGIFEGRYKGLGSYDVAAIKYAYGNKMELTVCPSYSEDPYCAKRRTVEIEPKVADDMWDRIRADFVERANGGAVINHTRREFAKQITQRLRQAGKIAANENAYEYMFCANQHMFRDAGCNIWDAGVTYEEIVDNTIKSYENRYYLGGLYRGLPYDNRRLSSYSPDARNFLLMRKMFDRFIYSLAGGYGFDSEEQGSPLTLQDNYIAVRNSYQWLIDTFKTPRVGTYRWDDSRQVFVRGAAQGGKNQIQINTDAGKHLYAQYEDFGLDPEGRRAIARGTIYEKWYSLLFLAGRSMVPGSEASDEILSISYFDVQDAFFSGQETILNLFSQALTGEVMSMMPVKGTVTLNPDQSLNFDIKRVLPLYANAEADLNVPVLMESLPLLYQFVAASQLIFNYTQDNQLKTYLDMEEVPATATLPNSPLIISFTPPSQPTKKIVVRDVNFVPGVGSRKSIAATIAAPAVQYENALAPVRALGNIAANGLNTYYGFLETFGQLFFQGRSQQFNDIMNNQILPAKTRDVQGHMFDDFLTRANNGKTTIDSLMNSLITIYKANPPADTNVAMQIEILISNYQAVKDLPVVNLSGLTQQQLFKILTAWYTPNPPALTPADVASSDPRLNYQFVLSLNAPEQRAIFTMAIYNTLGYPEIRDIASSELFKIEDALRNLSRMYGLNNGTDLGL